MSYKETDECRYGMHKLCSGSKIDKYEKAPCTCECHGSNVTKPNPIAKRGMLV